MPEREESTEEEFNRVVKEIQEFYANDETHVIPLPAQPGNNEADIHLRTFVDRDDAINYAVINGESYRTMGVYQNETGEYEVWEMGNPHLVMNEGQLSPQDEYRRSFMSYEDAMNYINEIGGGAGYFGIVEADGDYDVYYIAD